MKHISFSKFLIAALSASTVLGAPNIAFAQDAEPSASFKDIFTKAKPFINLRYRYEHVDQDNALRKANAHTLRPKFGVQSGEAAGFSFKLEGEAVISLGNEKFNDTTNGRTQFSVVADPEDIVFNQGYLQWRSSPKGSAGFTAKAGRQAINLDNQRWIGSVGWRQNDQTMDAAYVTAKPLKGLSASYGYIWRVNRIFGPDNPNGIWRDNDIHLLRASYDLGKVGTLSAFGYLLDIPNAPAASSETFGVRFTGAQKLNDDFKISYAVEYARQSEHGDNPTKFGLDYFSIQPGLTYGPFTLKLGYEQLDGDGQVGLQTPLATLHAFNGWADQFLVTPATGLEDISIDAIFKPKKIAWLKDTTFRFVYHDFSAVTGGVGDYGSEYDALISKKFGKHFTVSAKYANYQSDGFKVDTEKFWLVLGFNY